MSIEAAIRDLADIWCEERGLTAKDSTLSMMRKWIGATLKALHHKGAVRQDGHVDGRIGWRLASPAGESCRCQIDGMSSSARKKVVAVLFCRWYDSIWQ